jgi:hypothetical protein
MTCQKFSGETKAKQEGGIMKNFYTLPKQNWRNEGKRGRGIMENEMPSLLLDEKYAL